MNDERLGKAIGEFYQETDVIPPDSKESARQIATRLPRIPQVRRRWWLPPLRRAPTPPPDTDQTSDYQPVPIADGHTPTVTGRTQSMFSPVKAITAGALVFAIGGVLLIAQPFDQQGGSVPGAATDGDALWPALVTGTITYEDDGEFTCLSGPFQPCLERPSADGVTRFHIVGQTASVEMSDSRLSGDATVDRRSDGSVNAILPPTVQGSDAAYFREEGVGIAWGTIRIMNEAGAWEGTWIASSTVADDAASMIQLVGTGAYDGLSAILYEGSTEIGDAATEAYSIDGVIIPGELPPDR